MRGPHRFFSNSDDHLLKNIELFDKLSLRFNDRVLFIKDVIGDEICCWSFYGQGRKLAEVCCTSIVYATEKKQTKVWASACTGGAAPTGPLPTGRVVCSFLNWLRWCWAGTKANTRGSGNGSELCSGQLRGRAFDQQGTVWCHRRTRSLELDQFRFEFWSHHLSVF